MSPFCGKKGNVMIAARDIPAGSTVLEEEPAIWGPNNKSLPVCLGCLKPIGHNSPEQNGSNFKENIKNNVTNGEQSPSNCGDNDLEDQFVPKEKRCTTCQFPICSKECK